MRAWVPSPFEDDEDEEEHYVEPEIVPVAPAPKSVLPMVASAAVGFMIFGPVGALLGAAWVHFRGQEG